MNSNTDRSLLASHLKSMLDVFSFSLWLLENIFREQAMTLTVLENSRRNANPFASAPQWGEYAFCLVGVAHLLSACASAYEIDKDPELGKLIEDLESSIPDLKNVRDLLLHWDDYIAGSGHLQEGGRFSLSDGSQFPNEPFEMAFGNNEFIIGWPSGQELRVNFRTLSEKAGALNCYTNEYLGKIIQGTE
jgi:hypothetical protein